MGIYSVVFSTRRLGRPGVSKQVRTLFAKKHTYYVLAFIVLWTLQLIANYYHLFNYRDQDNSSTTGKVLDVISQVS